MSVNPERGGPTVQAGIYFQNCITTLRLAQMLAQEEMETEGVPYGKITSVRAEAAEEVDDTVVTYSSNRTEYIQAKLNLTFNGAKWKKLWEHFYRQYSDPTFKVGHGGVITLAVQWSRNITKLGTLLDRSRTSKSAAEWRKRLDETQLGILENIKASLATTGFKLKHETLFQFCRSIYPWINEFDGDPRRTDHFEKKVSDILANVVSNPAGTFDALMMLTGKGARIRVEYDYDDLVDHLLLRGIRLLTKAPSSFNVPALHNRYFVGRTNEIKQIHQLLTETQPSGPGPVGLCGMGGIGKTQIAVEYAYQHRKEYSDGVYWINGTEPLSNGFALLGKKLRPDVADQPMDEQISSAAKELQNRPNALLILDNLREPAELTQVVGADLIPASLPCRILLTTRRFDPERFRPVEIKELPDEYALRLLLRNPGRQPILDATHAEHKDALTICATLGNLPLALEVAGAHLGQRPNQPLAVYQQELLRLGALPLLDSKRGLSAKDSATRHDLAVTATLLSQWETLEKDESRLLLKVAGLLTEASAIPIARLALLSGLYRKADDFFGAPVIDAIEELKSTSLVTESQGDHVRLHPLVCAFARQQVPEGEFNSFLQECVGNVATAYAELPTLKAQATARGVDAIQDDLIKSYNLLQQVTGPMGPGQLSQRLVLMLRLSQRILLLLRLIQREIHSLRDLDPQQFAAIFIQQIHNRALTLGLDKLAQAAAVRLAKENKPHLLLRWRATRESPYLERTLVGHKDYVNDVVLMPGDLLAVSASRDQTIKIWDLITGQVNRTLTLTGRRVDTVAISPDGRYAASGSDYFPYTPTLGKLKNSEVTIWDAQTWQELRTLDSKTPERVTQVVITSDCKRVIASCGSEHIVWDLQTGRQVGGWETKKRMVRALAATRDGRTAVCGGSLYEVEVWDTTTGTQIDTLDNDDGEINAVAVTPDGRCAICAGSWGTISIWDLTQMRLVNRFKGHEEPVYCLKVTTDGCHLISGSSDQTIKIWNLQNDKGTIEPVVVLAGHSSEIVAIAASRDGKRIVSASSDQTLKVWNLAQGEAVLQESSTGHSKAVDAVSFIDGEERAFSVSEDGLFLEWGIQDGKNTRAITTNEYMRGVQITPDGKYAIGIHNYDLTVCGLRGAGGRILTLSDSQKPLSAVVMTSNWGYAISAGWHPDKTIQVWNLNVERVTPRTLVKQKRLSIDHLLLSPDEKYIIYKWIYPEIRIQDWRTGKLKKSLEYEGRLKALAITPDGKRVVAAVEQFAANSDETFELQSCALELWDFQSGKRLGHFEIDRAPISSITIGPDGRSLISVAEDYRLNVWDLESGKRLAMAILDGILWCVAISQDGESILTGDRAGNVYCLNYNHGDKN